MRSPFVLLPLMLGLGSVVHLLVDRQRRTARGVVELALLYLNALSGFGGLLGFLGHTARARETAAEIGWPAGNPFQYEVAGANLANGVLGLLGIWRRGDFWLASGIGQAVFLLSAGLVHLRELREQRNRGPGNAGPVLYLDFLLPAVQLGLLAAYEWLAGPKQNRKEHG